MEKMKKNVTVDDGEVMLSEDMISELKRIIEENEKKGATHFYVYEQRDRCGDPDGNYISFYHYREETDEEFERRIKREEEEEKRKLERLKAIEKSEMEQYLKLKQKLEKDGKL